MAFFDWIKQKLLGQPPERDISRLNPSGSQTRETVDRSGQPLKPGHRRKTHRDERLYPKANPLIGRRPKVMESAEAERLFSTSQRCPDRQRRDLSWDPEQLSRYGLPLWKDEAQVAAALGLTLQRLYYFANHRGDDGICHYVQFAIPKRGRRAPASVAATGPDLAEAQTKTQATGGSCSTATVPSSREAVGTLSEGPQDVVGPGTSIGSESGGTTKISAISGASSSTHRTILAPKKELKAVQRRLLKLLVEKLPVSSQACGFVRGKSVLDNAKPHVGRAVVVRMDLVDFFPHCTWRRVRGLLLAYGYSMPVANCLAMLMSESARQPLETESGLVFVPVSQRHCVQGAPTSPTLCNALVLKMDRRLAGLAKKGGFHYSRYADDLTFSADSPDRIHWLLHWVGRIVEDEGFKINADKTRIQRRGQRQQVTGVTVNQVAGLSRQERRKVRAALHRDPKISCTHLRGLLAYLKMLNPDQAAKLTRMAESRLAEPS